MSFLNPLMLLGTLAVAVPIVIHLLNKWKYQRVVWAAMRFLQPAIIQNQRRLRLEDVLLLLLRCALIVLLALALARPALRASSAAGMFGGGASVTAVIAIDNSFSMSGTDGVASRFDNARRAAEQVIDSLPGGSSVAVLLGSDIVDAVIPEPTLDLNLARQTIREAKLTDRGTNVLPVLRSAVALLKKAPGRREIYLLTDDLRSGWSQLVDVHRLLLASRDEVNTNVLLVGPAVEQSLAVVDLRSAGGLTPIDRPLRFEATVTNYGSTEAREVRVQLRVDADGFAAKSGEGAVMNVAAVDETTIDSIAGGASRVVSLFGKVHDAGTHAITAAVAPDRLPADDRRTIVIRGLQSAKVLIVDGDGGPPGAKNGAYFLRNALLPIPSTEATDYYINVKTLPAAQLPDEKLERYDAVFAANVLEFDAKTVDALGAYVGRGGGLVVFPGSNTGAAAYNRELVERTHLLPASIGEARGDAGQQEQFFSLQAKNFEHSIASLWNDPAAGTPAAAHFYRAFTLLPVNGARAVLRFADGSPAVLEQPVGLGRTVLFASTADTSWNDLPVRPGVFVPLLHRVLGSIVARQDESLNVRIGQRFMYRLPIDLLGRDVTVTGPGGVKDVRRIELQANAAAVQFDQTPLGGAYEAAVSGDGAVKMKFAAQLDAGESRLETLNDREMALLARAANVVRWTPATAIDQSIRSGRSGKELWTMLAMAVLIVAAGEVLLANWFSRAR